MVGDITNSTETDGSTFESLHGCVHTATLAVCTVLVIFVLFLGCTGNGMVLFTALTSKRLRNNFDLLIINLSGADFILCTCLSPVYLFFLFSDSPIPKVLCASILFLGTTSGLLSLLSLVCIALHRYWRVTGHARRPLTLLRVSIVVGVIWVISLSLSIGGTLHFASFWEENNELVNCQNVINGSDRGSNNFILFFIAPVTILSFSIIATSYGTIARMVRIQGVAETPDSTVLRNPGELDAIKFAGCTGEVFPPLPGQIRPSVRSPAGQTTLDKGNKALMMCLVVTLTIGLCWGPLIISQLMELVVGDSIILYQVKLCGIALIFLNSALDPYIYGQTNGRIKHKYVRLLYSLGRCECAIERTRQLRVSCNKALEKRPLNKSLHNTQDTNTIQQAGCSPKHGKGLSDRLLGPCFVNNTNNYTQNLLLQTDAGKFDTFLGAYKGQCSQMKVKE